MTGRRVKSAPRLGDNPRLIGARAERSASARKRRARRRWRRRNTGRMKHEAEEQDAAVRSKQEKRLSALAVMSGAFPPPDVSWWFVSGGWRKPWKQLARLPPRRRGSAHGGLAFSLALTAFVAWAVLSGHGALAAYAFVGLLGLWFAALPISLVSLGIRKRRLARPR